MKAFALLILGAAAVVLPAACSRRSHVTPAAADIALPATTAAVGPIPGPNKPVDSPGNPYGADPAARARGRQLFVLFNCSGCHGGRAGGGMGPSLRDQDWIYGGSAAQIFDSIAKGRANGMPAWGARLPEQSIWELTAYVQSLRTPDEPSPPN